MICILNLLLIFLNNRNIKCYDISISNYDIKFLKISKYIEMYRNVI